MTIRQNLDCLAVSLSFAEPDDQAALREVLDHLAKFKVSEDQKEVPELLANVCAQAAERIEGLVSGTEKDSDSVMEFVTQVVEFAQEIVGVVEEGGSADGMCPPWQADANSTPVEEESLIDDEMIDMFISECSDTLKEVEGQLLELENEDNPADTLAEIRRRVHTFKGECGVLSLDVAQKLCHEAETMIDRSEDAGGLPVDLLLDLVDWLGRHVGSLKGCQKLITPGHEELLERLCSACTEEVPAEPKQAVVEQAPPVQSAERVSFTEESLEDETLPEFIEEATGHLEEVEAALLEREENPDDPELLNKMFRAFHTIKGVAGFLNLEPLVRLAHRTETLLDEFRTEKLECTQEHVELIFAAKDLLGSMFEALAGADAPFVSELDALATRLDAAIAGKVTSPAPAIEASTTELLESIGVSGEGGAEAVAADPSKVWKKIGDILLERSILRKDSLQDALARQQTEAQLGRKKPLGTVLVELGLISEANLQAALQEQGGESSSAAAVMKAEVPIETPKKATRKLRTESFVKVGTRRLDSLVDMVGELVIAQQMLAQEPALEAVESEDLSRKLGHVAKITRDLQEGAMSLRMVTLKATFQKMARLVRDVAGKSKKDVKLRLVGEDTELDRNVVEQIGDPLVHLIRNSIDHGLESSEDRVAAGKSAQGTLELSSYHQGGSIVIDVRDDGKGLDCDRILAKATERGLVPEGTTREEIGDEEIHKMIFQAGFSTAAQVSDISGRGVGMDVVRKNIESMRGKVEIKSEQGVGSTFTLRLPLTLAIIDGMVVRVGGRRYILPTLSIEQSFQPLEEDLHSVAGEGQVVDVRGSLLPVHKVKNIFGLFDGTDEVRGGILILLESNGQRACFLVDEIIGQQQVVIKNLGKGLPAMQGVSGGAILGDGLVALILDVDGLLAAAQCV